MSKQRKFSRGDIVKIVDTDEKYPKAIILGKNKELTKECGHEIYNLLMNNTKTTFSYNFLKKIL